MKKPSAAMFPLVLMFEALSPEGSKFLAKVFGVAAGNETCLLKERSRAKHPKRAIEGEAGG
jgi:hypothetical protein